MTKAETIFWTYFKSTEPEKAQWIVANQAFIQTGMAPGHTPEDTDSEFWLADPDDLSRLMVIDDMPSQVWVRPDGEADVRWFDGAAQRYCRADLSNPVSVTYNRFGKVKRKSWLSEDGTLTERQFNA